MIIFTDDNNEDIRLDTYLTEVLNNFSRTKIQNLIKNKLVKINGQDKKSSYILRDGDRIDFELPPEDIVKIQPQNIPLDIIWEDENMLVVNKPAGMLTHPTSLEKDGTLVNALMHKYGDNLSDINGEFRRGIVHRLDRNTSGLLMIAKNNRTHEYLAQEIKDHKITKKYRTIVNGIYEKDEDVINLPVGRNPKQPHKMAVVADGKESITLVKVVERFKDYTYLELTLVTGRTHQIRVHLSSLHHPVFNDTLYGAKQEKVSTEEQVLQSYFLRFTKPFSDEIIELEIEPDEDFKKVLRYIKDRSVKL